MYIALTTKESAFYTYIPCSFDSSHPTLLPTSLGQHRAPAELLRLYSSFPTSCFTHNGVFMSVPKSPIHLTLIPHPACPCPSLRLYLCSCSENRFICAIFLDSTYIHYIAYLFFFLTDSRSSIFTLK